MEMTGGSKWTNGKSKRKLMETKEKAQGTAGAGAELGVREAKINTCSLLFRSLGSSGNPDPCRAT